MRGRGWTEAEVAERILPYMPPGPPAAASGGRGGGGRALSVPARASTAWLDQQLPAMDREQIRAVAEELEGRGWPAAEVAIAVLPHLLPKLAPVDANAILAGLRELGMTEEELTRLVPSA